MRVNKKTLYFIILSFLGLNITNVFADEEKNIYLDKMSNSSQEQTLAYIDGKIQTVNNNENKVSIKNETEADKKSNDKKVIVKTKNINKKNINSDPERPNDIYFVSGGKACFEEAAAYHHVDPWLLMSIAYVESGFDSNATNVNKNGSYDTGLMQINSIWFSTLKKKGIPISALKNPCASAYIGAWILADNIKRYGYNWRAIGAYNSGNPKIGLRYAKKVYKAHKMFTGLQTVYR